MKAQHCFSFEKSHLCIGSYWVTYKLKLIYLQISINIWPQFLTVVLHFLTVFTIIPQNVFIKWLENGYFAVAVSWFQVIGIWIYFEKLFKRYRFWLFFKITDPKNWLYFKVLTRFLITSEQRWLEILKFYNIWGQNNIYFSLLNNSFCNLLDSQNHC